MSHHAPDNLIGIGLYTPAEAARLVQVSSAKILRWLRGHEISGKHYDPLWEPQVDLGDQGIALGFRDLMEIRVASAFIERGLSAQKVRLAIQRARKIIGDERPLSTSRFRTDGRSVFLQIVTEEGETQLIDLFKNQYTFREVMERSLSNIEFGDDGAPARWWVLGKAKSIVIDPARSFGRPIEAETSVPAEVLAAAAEAEGSIEAAARGWDVPVRAVKRAVAFVDEMERRNAA
ncbi:hypothetical protein [Microvirga mediterraneensis]|uniref:hypothetical protein n=1 Tax=Microvirga mediterraneensis TaxID=2754695 RepID=UPI0031B5CB6B